MNNQDIIEQLDWDPMAWVEDFIGMPYNDEKASGLSLLASIAHTRHKREILREIGDTYMSMGWQEFKDMMKDHGWITLYQGRFDYYEKRRPAGIILAHPKKLIMTATSFVYLSPHEEVLNTADCYGVVQWDQGRIHDMSIALSGTSNHHIDRDDVDKRCFNMDAREGFFTRLKRLESYATLCDWEGLRDMWIRLPRYERQEEEPDYSLAAIQARKDADAAVIKDITSSVPWVKRFLKV